MPVANGVAQLVDKLLDWKHRNGDLPKRSRENGEENQLAVALSKLKMRRNRGLGPKPSERQLNTEEVEYVNRCLGLCPSVADGSADTAAPSAQGLCRGEDGQGAVQLQSKTARR